MEYETYILSSVKRENPISPKWAEKKQNSCQCKLSSFFTVERRQNSDGNLVEEVQSPKTTPNLLKSINSKNRTLEEDSNFEKTAAICGAEKKKTLDKNSYLLTKWTTKIIFLIFMNFYSG